MFETYYLYYVNNKTGNLSLNSGKLFLSDQRKHYINSMCGHERFKVAFQNISNPELPTHYL